MTVSDFVSVTADYQSYELKILSFGKNKLLFNTYIDSPDCEIKYSDEEVAAVKFSSGLLTLIIKEGD